MARDIAGTFQSSLENYYRTLIPQLCLHLINNCNVSQERMHPVRQRLQGEGLMISFLYGKHQRWRNLSE